MLLRHVIKVTSSETFEPLAFGKFAGFDPNLCGFVLTGEDYGGSFDNGFPPTPVFLKVVVSSRTPLPLFRPRSVHRGSSS